MSPLSLPSRAALSALALLIGAACVAPPKPHPTAERLSVEQVDTDGWDALLRRHVENGFVDYRRFCDAPELSRFLDQVARTDLSGADRDATISFLANAYNAATIDAVLRGGSPRHLLGRYRFFMRSRHPVAGEQITLWDLEREELLSLEEPRIHFAIVCASASCPRLASEAFRPETLDAQLEAAASAFVNDPTRNRFYPESGVAELSAIFDWYREDFESEGTTLSDYVARYVEDAEVARRLRSGALEIRFLPYDWSLNGVPPGPEGRCPSAS